MPHKTPHHESNTVQLTPLYQKSSACIGGGDEHAISEKGFRSPHVHRFSETPIPVNVLRVLSPYP
ncbi:hypothetical protein EY919_16760 [Citrobacter braakii]|nr:hypothetical protein EY919_16760 [Citrobacter braakii]TCC81324.1 hypothetical protein EY915_13725 [Citrobacter braakii]